MVAASTSCRPRTDCLPRSLYRRFVSIPQMFRALQHNPGQTFPESLGNLLDGRWLPTAHSGPVGLAFAASVRMFIPRAQQVRCWLVCLSFRAGYLAHTRPVNLEYLYEVFYGEPAYPMALYPASTAHAPDPVAVGTTSDMPGLSCTCCWDPVVPSKAGEPYRGAMT